MKIVLRVLLVLLCMAMCLAMLTGCRQSSRVSWNVSKEADEFNVVRRLTVINTRTDAVLLQMTGTFAIKGGSGSQERELSVICELPDGKYQKHFVYLNEWTTYIVEDLSGSEVSKYSYELNFLPESVPGVKIVSTD